MDLRTERCAASSELRDEPIAGTASTVRSWLLLEHPGPWGRDAFSDARLSPGLGPELLRRCRAARVRPLLIRRPEGGGADPIACFAIRSGPERPWIERTRLGRIEEALDADLGALGRGERLSWEPVEAALFPVCTHGRHDPCCAERGRPLAKALASVFPEETWECSHVGGDRFAGNVVAFPHGLYLGRVAPEDAGRVADAYLAGRISLRHLRGRSCWPMPVQAAEHALRTDAGLDGVDDVTVERTSRSDREVFVAFRTPGGRREVRIRIDASEPSPLTCRSVDEEAAPTYRILSIA